jgi:hypothetical protein
VADRRSTGELVAGWTKLAAPALEQVTFALGALPGRLEAGGVELRAAGDHLAAASEQVLHWLERHQCPHAGAGVELHSALSVLRNAARLLRRLADLEMEQSAVPPAVTGEHRIARLRASVAALLVQGRIHYEGFLGLLGEHSEALPRP